jgi:hypothetical protein
VVLGDRLRSAAQCSIPARRAWVSGLGWYFLTAQADDDPLPGVEVSPGMELVPVRLDAREVAEAFAVNLPPDLYPAPGYDLVGVLTGLVLEVMDDRKKDRGDPRS